ncbi:hypothetical protein THAOC_16280, partial [Thalassiosira oceanica]
MCEEAWSETFRDDAAREGVEDGAGVILPRPPTLLKRGQQPPSAPPSVVARRVNAARDGGTLRSQRNLCVKLGGLAPGDIYVFCEMESQRVWASSRRDGKLTAQMENEQTTQNRKVEALYNSEPTEDPCSISQQYIAAIPTMPTHTVITPPPSSRDRVDSRDLSLSRTSYAEWAATASAGGGMPKKRSLDSWRDDGGMDDGSGGNRRASASSSPGKDRRPRSPGAVRLSRSANDVTDLEVLGVTTQSINAALLSGAVPASSPNRAPDGAARSGEAQPYILSGAKFHPRGCVWDVSIQVLPASGAGENNSATWESTWQSTSKRSLMVGVGFEFDVKIHCVADEDPNPDDPGAAADRDGAAATRSAYTIELTLVHDDPDERALWQNYPAEISGATEWLRRKIRRKLRQGAGGRFPVPAVEVGLPGKVEFPTQVVADDGSPGDDPLDDVLKGRPVKLGPEALSSLMKTSPLPHGRDRGASPAKSTGGRPGLLKNKSSYTNRVQAEAAAGVRGGGGTRDGGGRRKGKVMPPATIDIPG